MKSPYLYLEEIHYTETWVNGGKIPIKLASSYKSDKRSGIHTPDEGIIDNTVDNIVNGQNSPIRIDRGIMEFLYPEEKRQFTNSNVFQNIAFFVNDTPINSYGYYSNIEDGLILSFCTKFCMNIMQRLGKKVCIQISNIFTLKQLLDKQLGCVGEYKKCKYTKTHNKNHFLKSNDDEWQQEWRIFWDKKDVEEILVEIPKNTAKLIFPKKR